MPPSPNHDTSSLVVVTAEVIEYRQPDGVTTPGRGQTILLFREGQVVSLGKVEEAIARGVDVPYESTPEGSAPRANATLNDEEARPVTDAVGALDLAEGEKVETSLDPDNRETREGPDDKFVTSTYDIEKRAKAREGQDEDENSPSDEFVTGEPAQVDFDQDDFKTVVALRGFASANGIDLDDARSRSAIVEAIESDPRVQSKEA